MISKFLVTMCFHSVLGLVHLLHIGPNHLTISFSHHYGGLLNNPFQSLELHLITARVHLLSVNFVM